MNASMPQHNVLRHFFQQGILPDCCRWPAEKEGFRIYQIRSNDTLIRIANRFHLKTYKELLEWNPQITNPRIIIPGDYLYIKRFH